MKTFLNKPLAVLFVLTCAFVSTANAQQTREYSITQRLGGYSDGYSIVVVYDATFEGFATQLKIHNTRLYITDGPSDFEEAAENSGLKKVYIPGAYSQGYPIEKFDLYIDGTVILSKGSYSESFLADFKVQVSGGLGDFTTPEFSEEAKNYYKNEKNVWEDHGSIRENMTKVTEMHLRNFDVRISE